MTSLDPSHLPSRKDNRGNAIIDQPRSSRQHHHPLPPGIPDLRFEQSYLLSIRPFVKPLAPAPDVESKHKQAREAAEDASFVKIRHEGDEAPVDVTEQSLYGAPIVIDWKGLLWVTARDQVLSPLAQGALWGVASMFVLPVITAWRTRLFQNLTNPFRGKSSNWELASSRKKWLGNVKSGVETNVALAK